MLNEATVYDLSRETQHYSHVTWGYQEKHNIAHMLNEATVYQEKHNIDV